MRLYEFDSSLGADYANKIKLALNNLIGRSASKGQAANYNWEFLNSLPELQGIKLDQRAFANLYDLYPAFAELVKNFDDTGVSLKVPGVSPEKEEPGSDIDKSKENVRKAAATAAQQNISS